MEAIQHGSSYASTSMKPWYRDGLRFTCTQCGDCCRSHGDYQWVFLTPDEVTRLAKHLGMTNAKFLHEYCDKDEDGLGHTLKWPDRACVFLGQGSGESPGEGAASPKGEQARKEGCTVYDARPQQCRTWPFWPENLPKKVWDKDIVPFCPGAGEGRLYSLGEIRKISKDQAET